MRLMYLALVGSLMGGCAFDPHRHRRPSRLQLGMNARQYAVPPPASTSTSTSTSKAVVGESTETATEGGLTGAAQFTQTLKHFMYVGGEVEAGALGRSGSNIAGAAAVFGLEHSASYGALALEVAGGYRSIRPGLGEEEFGTLIVEPRLRGQVWISPQLTLGAAAGTNLEDGAWMAGFYLGVHSEIFGAWKPASRR